MCRMCRSSEVAVSDSKGQLSLIELSATGGRLSRQWSAHCYEAWIVAFGHEPSTLYSGGDDCRLCVWDLRTTCSHPAMISKRCVCVCRGKCTSLQTLDTNFDLKTTENGKQREKHTKKTGKKHHSVDNRKVKPWTLILTF